MPANVSSIAPVREALATGLGEAMEVTGIPYTPSRASAGTVFIRPGNPWIEIAEGSWRNPLVRLAGCLVAPKTGYEHVLDWIEDRIDRAHEMLDDDPTLGDLVDDARIIAVSEPGRLTDDLIAVRFDLRPMEINALHDE